MAQSPTPRSTLGETLMGAAAETRHRELAVEHLLFWTLAYIERERPGLVDYLDGTLESLGDHADDDTKDDEAVREVARRLLQGLRKQA